MDKESLLRLVDSLHRDKEIAKDVVFQGIEAALTTAARKHFKSQNTISIQIDRNTGEIIAMEGDHKIDPSELGRITAQTAKQVIIQKIREAERDVIYEDFTSRKSTIVSGTVQRFEGSTMVVNLGKTESILHKPEQIADEHYNTGERIRAIVLDVKKAGARVKILLSRAHPDFVRRLFELEVPEIAEGTIEIKSLAREPGHRTKIAVASSDPNVDSVGACVGVRGARIKNIVDELNGEKIDIIRWCDEPELLLPNALKPAEVSGIILSAENKVATIVVPNDQLSLAIGKRGQNVRLAARLTSWDIDIITESELEERQKSHAVELTEVAETNKMPSSDLPAKHEISPDNIETSDKKEES
ncbi:MAG: Transcription termination protein NusA [Candidatus Jettenia ecosi]|uniref:Transcription termination/antitermination protein NusA n=1 Tax=Candidatus Jettenia ecosi TaxID=2494326 RepID=A0A533QCT9_9BACT|nr:MAG: Transcription termination protein NusA [Candidatus Jettenia ecosi]